MHYYRVLEGKTLTDTWGKVLGSDGDVVELPTDSSDKSVRQEAEGILCGQWSKVAQLAGKPAGASKKKASKKATYSTKDATPEG